VFEFGAVGLFLFVFFELLVEFHYPVFCVLDRFEVGEGLSVECVVAVGPVLVLVLVASPVFGVFDDVSEFGGVAFFDDEDGFSVLFCGSLQVLKYFDWFG